MTQYVTKEALQKMVTLQKGYIDTQVATRMEKFTVGTGLDLTDGVLSVSLDMTPYKMVTELPAAPTAADANKIFVVLSENSEEGNAYTEYLYLGAEAGWEKLGEFKPTVDLTPYLKIADLTADVAATGFTLKKGTTEFLKVTFGTSDFTGSLSGSSLALSLATVTTAKDLGFYKVKLDAKGRVIESAPVAEGDITALGFSTTAAMGSAIAAAVKAEEDARKEADEAIVAAATALANKVKALEDAEADRSPLTETEAQALFESIYG